MIPGVAACYGGPSAAIVSLCNQLQRIDGVDVEVATTDANGPDSRLSVAQISQVQDGFDCPVHFFGRTRSEQWKYSSEFGKWISGNAQHFDVIHIHALWSYCTWAAAGAAIAAGVPYVIRPCGMLSKYTFGHGRLKKMLYWQAIEKRNVRRAARFHATSSQEKVDVLDAAPEASVSVIANGVSDEAWELAQTVERKKRSVLYLSRIHPKKGVLDILLPALDRVPSDVELVIAGGVDPHDPDYFRTVDREIERGGLKARVKLVGEIAPQDRWQYFDAATLFVLPSHSENFGIVVAEAMARRCPVVVTDQVQSCEHVIAADAGIVTPVSPTAVGDAISKLLADENLASQCGRNGFGYARDHFRWSKIAEDVAAMYREVLGEA